MAKSDRDAILMRRARFIATALASAGVTVATAEGCAKQNDVPATARPTSTVEVPDLDSGARGNEPDGEPLVRQVEADAEPPPELSPQVCLEPPEPKPKPPPQKWKHPSVCLWID